MKKVNLKFSRLLSLALVFLLALTTAVPALAAGVEQNNLEVVIHNNEGLPKMNETQFTVYQLFTGTPNKEDVKPGMNDYGAENWNNYTLADVKWGESVKEHEDALLAALKNAGNEWAKKEDGTNVFADITDAAGLAKVLEEHKDDNAFLQHFATTVAGVKELKAIDVTPTLTKGVEDDASDDYLTYKFEQPGYYMFADTHELSTTDADARSEYILAVLGDQEINLKASVPNVDKEIVDSKNTNKGDVAGVGDYVQFKLTGTLPANFADYDVYKYIFHDTLSKGLTYVTDGTHSLTVTVYPSKEAAAAGTSGITVTLDGNYTVATKGTEIPDPKCNLEITFEDLSALKNAGVPVDVTKDSVIVVTYWAQVNTDAVIGVEGNPNTVLLEYSNDPNHEGTGKTKEKKVYVYAFGLDLKKIGSDKPEGLKDAGFVLKDTEGNYAIFKDMYMSDAGEFSETKDDTYKTPERRLTGWTGADTEPTTEQVKGWIAAYKEAKEAFDKAPNDQRIEGGSAYTALQAAKDKLAEYLLISDDTGAIPDVYGLDEGKYALEEVIVPDGYNSPKTDFDIEIQADIDAEGKLTKVTYKHGDETVTYLPTSEKYTEDNLAAGETVPEDAVIGDRISRFQSGLLADTIENQKAPFLPFTGGVGTLIFYILGAALIAGAVTYLVIASKKRKKAENIA